jgi:hypothetical protein
LHDVPRCGIFFGRALLAAIPRFLWCGVLFFPVTA